MNVNWLALIWTTVAGIALLLTCGIWAYAFQFVRAVHVAIAAGQIKKGGTSWEIAYWIFWTTSIFFVVWLFYIIIGLLSLSVDLPQNPDRAEAQFYSGLTFIAMQILLAAKQGITLRLFWNLRRRTRINIAATIRRNK